MRSVRLTVVVALFMLLAVALAHPLPESQDWQVPPGFVPNPGRAQLRVHLLGGITFSEPEFPMGTFVDGLVATTINGVPLDGEQPLVNWSFLEQAIFHASDALTFDNFGESVAISGDTAIVGAKREDGGPGDPLPGAGAAYVFQRTGAGAWVEAAKLVVSDLQAVDEFGVSVAISGDTAIVGSWGEDGGPGDPVDAAGAAYVFGRNQGGVNNWGEVAKLIASDAQATDNFGRSVAISGGTAIVGAFGEDGGPGDPLDRAGAAYVFVRDQGGANNWGEVAKLTASDAQADDTFSTSMAISGDTAIVGARGEDGGPGSPLLSSGAAYLFGRDQGGDDNWGEVAKLTASDAQVADSFGIVAISGDTAIVGANWESGGAGDPINRAGAAYVFRRDQGGANNWGEAKKLTASDAQASDFFGYSVAISGDTAIVGAYGEGGGPGDPLSGAGAAYVFGRNQGGADHWGEVKLTASDTQANDLFGSSVAISGDTAIVGAHREDHGPGDVRPDAGAAYVFRESFLGFFKTAIPLPAPRLLVTEPR